jgi:hypothetical protein
MVQKEDSVAGQGLGISSRTTGGYEEMWVFEWTNLKYSGFDRAADLYTSFIVAKLHSCPFSQQDKADFDSWISNAQHELSIDVSSVPKVNGLRPDRGPDYPGRRAMADDAATLEKSGAKQEFLKSKCYVGGAVPI